MDELPADIMRIIADGLDARALSSLACVSRSMREVVDELPVSLSLQAKTPTSVCAFLDSAAGRIFRLRSSSIVANHRITRNVANFVALRHLKLRNCAFPAAHAVAALPIGLLSLFVDKIRVSPGASSKFNTAQLDRLVKGGLEQLSLEFSNEFERATLDHREAGLKSLTIRAPGSYIVVRRVVPAPSNLLRLDAQIVVARGNGRVCAAAHNHIKTTEFPPSRRLFDHASCANAMSLVYECPSRHWMPELRHFTNLERLALKLDLAISDPDDLTDLKNLKTVTIKNRFGYASAPADTFRGFPPGFDCVVTVGGAAVESRLFAIDE